MPNPISCTRFLYASVVLSATLLQAQRLPDQLRLIEIDPGHSHLSGLHARPLPGVSDEVHVYSPLTAELVSHLSAIARFNHRPAEPTHWQIRLFAGPDYLAALKQEAPGNIVALSGRNEKKISYIQTALEEGQNVFADKPWIIALDDLPKLEAAVNLANRNQLVTYDWMTLRGDMAYQLQRELVMDPSIFGHAVTGSLEQPAVRLENLHALLKWSNGVPQQRPASFLDVRQQGEGMADVGTHLADLAQWTLFPAESIAYGRDIRVLTAAHSPLTLTLEQFTRLTGETTWPEYLAPDLIDNHLRYFANGSCIYTIRGVYVRLKVGWEFEAPPGVSDSYLASYRGTNSQIELRAGAKEHYIPQIYVIPVTGYNAAELDANLKKTVARLHAKYPGLAFEKVNGGFHLLIPRSGRSGDDLQNIFKQFVGFVHDHRTFPTFENTNLIAKYYVTTKAVAMARSQQ